MLSTGTAVRWRLGWQGGGGSGGIYFQVLSHNHWDISVLCQARGLSFSPHRPLQRYLQCSQDLTAGFLQNQWSQKGSTAGKGAFYKIITEATHHHFFTCYWPPDQHWCNGDGATLGCKYQDVGLLGPPQSGSHTTCTLIQVGTAATPLTWDLGLITSCPLLSVIPHPCQVFSPLCDSPVSALEHTCTGPATGQSCGVSGSYHTQGSHFLRE